MPLTPNEFFIKIINPALLKLQSVTTSQVATSSAKILLLAIALEESNLQHRQQIKGPARSFWQFERIGIEGVVSRKTNKEILSKLNYPTLTNTIYTQLLTNDQLGCILARLLLLSDPNPLPEPKYSEITNAYNYYLKNWRPGKKSPASWKTNWPLAIEVAHVN